MNEREKDPRAEELADLARRLESALEVEAPEARSEKALFVAGVGTHARRSSWTAALVPAAAVAVLIALAVVSRTALPGQTLYPVRKVLGGVGLAPSTAAETRALLSEAEQLVVTAEGAVLSAPTRAQELARRAMVKLEEAERLAGELDGERADSFDAEIDALEDRADDAYDAADDTLDEREEAAEEDGDEPERGDDSSGPGSGGGDDSSGSGSGGDGSGDDDSSGSGSGGDDSGGDDSSGSGSGGDDSGGDDSSGSGSGGDDSDNDDSSGKG